MALSITQTDSTQTTVTIWLQGMDINYPRKALEVYIDGSFHDDYQTNNSGFGLYYTVENLNANTSYSLEIRVFCYKNNDWYADPDSSSNVVATTISTSGGSGPQPPGPSTDGYFIITEHTNGRLTVQIKRLSGLTFGYDLFDSPDSSAAIQSSPDTSSTEYTFTNLSQGTYYVEALYQDGINWVRIESDSGNLRQRVDVSGGSGPTPTGDGYVYIYTGSRWAKAKPYIYTGPINGWQSATPYIYTGSVWKKCTD